MYVRLFNAAILCLGVATASGSAEALLEKINLFDANQGGYAHYRIPGIVVTSKGTLLAYCEARKNTRGDWGMIDIVMRRSSDGGKSWEPARKIVMPPPNVAKNPVALKQSRDGTIYCFYERETASESHYNPKALCLARFNLEWLTDGQDQGEKR